MADDEAQGLGQALSEFGLTPELLARMAKAAADVDFEDPAVRRRMAWMAKIFSNEAPALIVTAAAGDDGMPRRAVSLGWSDQSKDRKLTPELLQYVAMVLLDTAASIAGNGRAVYMIRGNTDGTNVAWMNGEWLQAENADRPKHIRAWLRHLSASAPSAVQNLAEMVPEE